MQIISKLKEGISRISLSAEVDDLAEDVGLLQQGIIDSYGFIELITYIEKEFQIVVEDDQLTAENFSDLKHIAAFVESRINK